MPNSSKNDLELGSLELKDFVETNELVRKRRKLQVLHQASTILSQDDVIKASKYTSSEESANASSEA